MPLFPSSLLLYLFFSECCGEADQHFQILYKNNDTYLFCCHETLCFILLIHVPHSLRKVTATTIDSIEKEEEEELFFISPFLYFKKFQSGLLFLSAQLSPWEVGGAEKYTSLA